MGDDIPSAPREPGEDRRADEEVFRQIAGNINQVLWNRSVHDRRVRYVNDAYARVWQRSPDALLEDSGDWLGAVHPEDRSRVEACYAKLDESEFEVTYRIVRDDGETRWIRDRGFAIRDESGRVTSFAGVAEDITALRRNEDALRDAARVLQEIAIRDPLTDLINRRGLERALAQEAARVRRSGARLAALLVDCDDFKTANDQFGHAFGDAVLQEVSRRLTRALRPTDVLARVGGDEFIALLPDTRIAEAFRVAERVRDAVAAHPVEAGTSRFDATVSIGVSDVAVDAATTKELLTQLQLALKRGKRGGKNRVATALSAVEGSSQDALLLEGKGLRVVAQSIRALSDDRPVGMELLSRGPSGDELENPEHLFRAAVERDLLRSVDLSCVENCLDAVEARPDLEGRIHVNLYPSTLESVDLDRWVELFCGRFGSRRQFCVELSEQQVIGQPGRLRERVAELQKVGVLVALDDVGFGRSSLEALIVLEPDVIKVDRAFVTGCASDPAKRHWLDRLVRVVDGLSAYLIAEGIESRSDLEAVRDAGVQFGQGFFWDRPHELADVN